MAARPQRLAPYLDEISATDRRALGDAIYELATLDLRPQLPDVRAPVLAVLADGVNQDAFRHQAEVVPDHTVVVVPGAGHFVMLDDPPATFAAIDRFLRRKDVP
jgi:pimeloyl-ACP methyl ester carboxylesterase